MTHTKRQEQPVIGFSAPQNPTQESATTGAGVGGSGGGGDGNGQSIGP